MLKPINGRIIPAGWILEHLKRDKEGITGKLEHLCEDAASGIFEDKKVKDETNGVWSSWWPGETEGNWRDALARLAFALGDEDLVQRVTRYVERILQYQDEDGYIGIFQANERFGNGARSGELWTQSRIMGCLITYYENTRDDQVLKALERLADLIVTKFGPLAGGRSLYQIPDEDGSKTHSLMIIEPLLYLYDHSKKPEYLDFCVFLYEDYTRYAKYAKFPCYDLSCDLAQDPEVPFVGHGPHTAEQLRIPLLLYKATGNELYCSVFKSAVDKLKRYMTLSGSCKSDELIGAYYGHVSEVKQEGLDIWHCYPIPGLGYEYCSTTELMLSFNSAVMETMDMEYADMEEWLVMNAAMAAKRSDGKAIQYLCADNLYEASKAIGDRWDYSPTHTDAAVCCAPNSGKVMPGHLSRMWLTDERESLHAVYYGPCILKTRVGDAEVTIEEKTAYPFENHVTFHISADREFDTCLYLRVPGWSTGCEVLVNGASAGEELIRSGKGQTVRLERIFRDRDTIEVTFKARPRLVKAVDGTFAVAYGPLLYSLNIEAEAEDYFHYDLKPFCDTNYRPVKGADWNYTLLYDHNRPDNYIRISQTDEAGYEWDKSPVKLQVKMLSSWGIPRWVDLVPIGCTILRRTTFPMVEDIWGRK
ncbi:MAG TPA: glycoside hydrolase family 127 protein [Candidatus Atribacteria bacterium]|nr:glycoside hydrolase family 127 protein [Candidatus Atribacteria bacterium]HPT79308.1 glycoside hydrolase family 127 protein [Candidatus Atribacteria bacterium]